jgi:rhodanese-related sulfurtransferase
VSLETSASATFELRPVEAWQYLEAHPGAVLIDVRTEPEHAFAGYPVLSSIGKKTLFLPWRRYPDMEIDPLFLERLARLANVGDRDVRLLFICKVGGRSAEAAGAARKAFGLACVNLSDGFEGPLNERRQRGTIAGWKAAGLPWEQR